MSGLAIAIATQMLSALLSRLGLAVAKPVLESLVLRFGPAILQGHPPNAWDVIRLAVDLEEGAKIHARNRAGAS